MTYRLRYTGTLDWEAFDRIQSGPLWYHSYYFDNGFAIRGQYDIGADVADYGFPEDLAGLRVLDVGTAGGWFAHYFADRGADVWAVDAHGYGDFDVYGRHDYEAEDRPPDRVEHDGTPVYIGPATAPFFAMRDTLGAPIRFRNARIYNLHPDLFDGELFDLVFIGALLLHLRDPIGALMAARRVCRERVMASTPVLLEDLALDARPVQHLPWSDIDRISWWMPNLACFRHWFLAAGFREPDVSRQITYRCDVEQRDESGRVVNADQTFRVGRARV